MGLGPTLMTSFTLITPVKTLYPTKSLSKVLGVRTSTSNLGGAKFNPYNWFIFFKKKKWDGLRFI